MSTSNSAGAAISNAADSKQAAMLMASAPQAAPDFQFALSPGLAPESGLQNAHHLGSSRHQHDVLDLNTIGGFRQDPLPWHPNGLAIDVMIPNYHSPEGIELGNQIAGFALANAKRYGILHVIWRQGILSGYRCAELDGGLRQ